MSLGANRTIKTYALLDQMVAILGGTKLTFLPILSNTGTELFPYGSGNDVGVALTQAALESVFDPKLEIGGIYSLYNDSSVSANTQFASDEAAQSFAGTGGMSVGGWFMPTEDLGTARTFLSKYDATGAAEVREWDFRMDTSGNLVLELYDESANASEIGTGSGDTVVPWVWNFVVATYDGTAATPAVHLYRDASDTLSGGGTTETGAFVDMEDTATIAAICAQKWAGSIEAEFEGRFALPFMCGKELSSVEVTALYNIGRTLLGV